jgi:hypothetical protein
MRKVTLVSSATVLAATCCVLGASPALAGENRSGPESATGWLVAATTNGTRQVLASEIQMRGVFNAVGRIVETEVPGDPANVNRDDLVFPVGTISIKSTVLDVAATVDPQTCVETVRITQKSVITGGTGRLSDADGSFDGTVNGYGVVPRTPDGSCDANASPLLEVDHVQAWGQMSF